MRTFDQSKHFDFSSCWINPGAIFKNLFLKAMSRGANLLEIKKNVPKISKKSKEANNLSQDFKANAMLQQQLAVICEEIFADLDAGEEFLLTDECKLLQNDDYAFLRKFLATPVKPCFNLVKSANKDSRNLFNADDVMGIFDDA